MKLQRGMLFISILIFTLSCTKIEPGFEFQKAGSSKKSTSLQNAEIEKMRREVASRLDSLRIREKMLLQKETSLDSLQYTLKLREIMLKEKEDTVKIMRLISFFILFIGIVLTAVGTYLLLQIRKKTLPGSAPTHKELFPIQLNKTAAENGKEPVTILAPVRAEPEKTVQMNMKPGNAKARSSKKQTVDSKEQTGEILKPQPNKAGRQQNAVKPVTTKTSPGAKKAAAPKKQTRKPAVAANKIKKTGIKRSPAGNKKQQQTTNEKEQS
ncbi:MAG TPA: hypothetical protein PLP19_15745 [bacterium]|nr:hypothetical protein [bacterium]HPN44945.1 hypothetical protein [bacterium]